MSAKSWLITAVPMIVGVGFTVITMVTGQEVPETYSHLLDYLLVQSLGSGAIGAANKGYQKYQEYKKSKTI